MSDEKINEETYSLIYSSLKHPIRRKILRMLEEQELSFSEILEALEIDSGHLSYHLENLGDLVTHAAEGKYGLSTFGKAAVKLMSGVEEKPKTNKTPKNRVQTFVKVFSVGLAVILLLVGLFAIVFTTSDQFHYPGEYGPQFTLAQGQTFSYPVNFTNSAENINVGFIGTLLNVSNSPLPTPMKIWYQGFVVTSEGGTKFVDSGYGNSLDISTKYRMSFYVHANQIVFPLSVQVYDSEGKALCSPQYFKSSTGVVLVSGLNEVTHLGTCQIDLASNGTEPLNASVQVEVWEEQFQNPFFYYGLAISIAALMYMVIALAVWIRTKY